MSNAEVTEEDKAAAVVAFRRLLGFDPMPLLSKSDSAVTQILQEFHAQARAAGKAEGRREENMACYAAAMVTCAGCNGQGTAPSNHVLGGGLECGECQGTGAGTIGEALDEIAKRREQK